MRIEIMKSSIPTVTVSRRFTRAGNNRIHELLQRNLQEVFGEGDAPRPHFVYTPHGEPQALQNAAGRLAWGSGPRGEAPEYTGLDVIIVRDGKIAALYVFLDSMPPR